MHSPDAYIKPRTCWGTRRSVRTPNFGATHSQCLSFHISPKPHAIYHDLDFKSNFVFLQDDTRRRPSRPNWEHLQCNSVVIFVEEFARIRKKIVRSSNETNCKAISGRRRRCSSSRRSFTSPVIKLYNSIYTFSESIWRSKLFSY